MITNAFEFHAPDDLDEALRLLASYGDDAKVIAGGMSMVPMMTLGLVAPAAIISLRKIANLSFVRDDGDAITVGAMTRHYQVAGDPLVCEHAPLLAETAGLIGDVQVRNRGTIGGSLAHADPAANYSPAVMALDAVIEVSGPEGRREVEAGAFFSGLMTTAVGDNEIVTAVRIPKRSGAWGSSFQKFTRVTGSFPIVCAAALVERGGGQGCVVFGGVGDVPVRVELEDALRDGMTEASRGALSDTIAAAVGEPFGDLSGSPEYRREMAQVFGVRAIEAAWARADDA